MFALDTKAPTPPLPATSSRFHFASSHLALTVTNCIISVGFYCHLSSPHITQACLSAQLISCPLISQYQRSSCLTADPTCKLHSGPQLGRESMEDVKGNSFIGTHFARRLQRHLETLSVRCRPGCDLRQVPFPFEHHDNAVGHCY